MAKYVIVDNKNNYIEKLRVVLFISVFLYHLNILYGGFFAVCSFFVLSGYLSVLSLSKKDKINYIKYYKKKFYNLYLPFIAVLFTSIIYIYFKDIMWVNIKSESLSIILGYNNFYQISIAGDYFSKGVSSPFVHYWYICILLQYELLFPLIYCILSKITKSISRYLSLIISILLVIGFSAYFCYSFRNNDMSFTYFHSLTRAFSFFFGVLTGVLHVWFKPIKLFKNNIINKLIFYLYLLILIILFIFIKYNNNYFDIFMIITSIITCRIIDYAYFVDSSGNKIINGIVNYLSNISYEGYLWQYPVIFIISTYNLSNSVSLGLITIITVILATLLDYCTIRRGNSRAIVISKVVFKIIFIILTIIGIVCYFLVPNYENYKKELEKELEKNNNSMQELQDEYKVNKAQEEEEWGKILESLNNDKEAITSYVSNVSISAIGDSVMLGASPSLYNKFSNIYVDAAVSRSIYAGVGILNDLIANNKLGEIVVIGLGTNGNAPWSTKRNILNLCEGREVFWINVVNDSSVKVNDSLVELQDEYSYLHVIDWYSNSLGHDEYFAYDGIHLTYSGREAYTSLLFDNIYNYYYKKYEDNRNKIIKEHDEKKYNNITFYGNDLLLNNYSFIKNNYENSLIEIVNDGNEIINIIRSNDKTKRTVFMFDYNIDYDSIIKEYENEDIYIVLIKNQKINVKDNVHLIELYKTLEDDDYLFDKVHLSEKGYNKLNELLLKEMK